MVKTVKGKTILSLIFFLLIFISCEKNVSIQKVWISTKWTQSIDSKKYKLIKEEEYDKDFESHIDSLYNSTIEDKLIYQFKEDSFIVKHFNKTLYYAYNKYNYNYKHIKDSIYVSENNERVISYKVDELTESKLIISYYLEEAFLNENKIILQPIKKFNCNSNKDNLKSFLTDSDFVLTETNNKVTFHKPNKFGGKISVSNSDNRFNLKTNDGWYVTMIEDELFLVVGIHVIQIIEIQTDRIVGYTYGEQNKEIILEKIVQIEKK